MPETPPKYLTLSEDLVKNNVSILTVFNGFFE
jgi:hypothetical protein